LLQSNGWHEIACQNAAILPAAHVLDFEELVEKDDADVNGLAAGS